MMVYIDTGLKNSLLLTEDGLSWWIDACKKKTYPKGKTTPIKKIKTEKRKHPEKLQAHNVPTDNVENTNGIN